MLKVTERASKELKQVLEGAIKEPDQLLRLVTDLEGNYKLTLDTEREGDQVVEHEGTKIMVISPEISTELEGAVLDSQDTPVGPVLTISRGDT
jgi:Fe-S cluster assembly iron-binding protein IscA